MSTQGFSDAPSAATASDGPSGRAKGRWRALGVTAVGLIGIMGAAWIVRAPIAQSLLGAALSTQGIASQFTVESIDFGHIVLKDVRLGNTEQPDLAVDRVAVDIAWRPTPAATAIRLDALRLKGAYLDTGLSFGSLDRFWRSDAAAQPFAPPDLALTLNDASAAVTSPWGTARATLNGGGNLARDFSASGGLQITDTAGGLIVQNNGPQGISVESTADGAAVRVNPALLAAQTIGEFILVGLSDATAKLSIKPGALTPTLAAGAVVTAKHPTFDIVRGDLTIGGTLAPNETLTMALAATDARAGPLTMRNGLRAKAAIALAPQGMRGTWRATADEGLTLTAPALAALNALAAPADTPFGPTLTAIRSSLRAAGTNLQAMDVAGDFDLGPANRVGLGVASLSAANGARLELTPGPEGFGLQLTDARAFGSAKARLTGGGVPVIEANANADADGLRGRMAMATVRAGAASLAATIDSFSIAADWRSYSLQGAVEASGPLAGGRVDGLTAPLRLQGRLGDGFSLAPSDGRLLVSAKRMTAAGGVFAQPRLEIVPGPDGFLRRLPNGDWRGGFTVPGRVYHGRLEDTGAPAALQFDGLRLSIQGDHAVATVVRPTFAATLADGPIRVQAAMLTARLDAAGVRGAIEDATVEGSALPVEISAMGFDFATQGEAMRLSNGRALVRDRPPPATVANEEPRARFNPMALRAVTGMLDEGVLTTAGDVVLVERREADRLLRQDTPLGRFSARHALTANEGAADVRIADLQFGPSLDAYDISDPIRGIASDVEGGVSADLHVKWRQGALSADGAVVLTDISFNTAALGPVDKVNGAVRFDDLLAVRTAPDQILTIGRIDPGIGVVDGTVAFQVLGPTRLKVAKAEWPFAAGRLSIEPLELDLNSRATALTLELQEVDFGSFIETLGLKDIAASGRVAGRFPLVFSEQNVSGEIVNGQLYTLPGGGFLSYTGPVSDALTGPPRLAFDALQGLRYERLSMSLNGPLAGNIEGNLSFAGINTTPLRDTETLIPIPGLQTEQPVGLPFAFDVSVTAPFRKLLESYQGTVDAWSVARRALDTESATPVDPAPPSPR